MIQAQGAANSATLRTLPASAGLARSRWASTNDPHASGVATPKAAPVREIGAALSCRCVATTEDYLPRWVGRTVRNSRMNHVRSPSPRPSRRRTYKPAESSPLHPDSLPLPSLSAPPASSSATPDGARPCGKQSGRARKLAYFAQILCRPTGLKSRLTLRAPTLIWPVSGKRGKCRRGATSPANPARPGQR